MSLANGSESFPDLTAHIERIAAAILGSPNKEHSTATQLQFGTNGSVAVEIGGERRGSWYDHEVCDGGGPWDLITRKGGMVPAAAFEWLRSEIGLDIELPKKRSRIVATYDYKDANGALVFQVVRYEPKDFRQRRPDGNGGWEYKVKGLKLLPYRLSSLLAAPDTPIFIVEGEKDADRLTLAGLVATCNPMGAGKWRPEFALHFQGRDCIIVPDNDQAGRDHADAVGADLQRVAKSVRILALPDLPPKGDVTDWLNGGGLVDDLRRLALTAPLYRAKVVEQGHNRPPVAEAPEFSEDALALEFAELHKGDLRYVSPWSRWLEWDGVRWRTDTTLKAFDLVRAVCRRAAMEDDPNLASASVVAAVERLSKADRRLAAMVDQWDRDLWLLNTPAGTIDLRTGDMRPHRREDYCTKSTAVAPGGDCSLWLAFLEKITGGDRELKLFLQRVAGYALTGSTAEHALFFGYGTGGNGKGVFINTLSGVMGDYATTAPMETFIATHGDRHPTELAGLRGARLVTAQETEEGRRWAESKIKALTGGDTISARFMRQDFFEFVPQFKLFIMGNHKPGLRGVDEAIRRRMNLIPFTVTVTAEERDEQLPAKLRAEWPGILQWMVDGCTEWQGEGLAKPEIVRRATDAYLDAEDALAQWMAERCVIAASRYSTTADLFVSWKSWADASGEFAGSQKRFSQGLEARGFRPRRQGGTGRTGFDGIGVAVEYGQPARQDDIL